MTKAIVNNVEYTSHPATDNKCDGCVADISDTTTTRNERLSLCVALPDCHNIIWKVSTPKGVTHPKILTVSSALQIITVKKYTLTLTEDQLNEIYGLICDSDGGVFLSDLQHEIEML